jgi:CRISPR system Cascade subunit CasB
MAEHWLYWEDFLDADGKPIPGRLPRGEDLAALRRGLGREAGTVPSMWRFHRTDLDDTRRDSGRVDGRFRAEHHALTLFAVHQQSQDRLMHAPATGLGRAMRQLHALRGESAGPALDRRFYAAVTAESVNEVAYHLRGLVQLLRSSSPAVPLDYTALYDGLRRWASPEPRDRVRRQWGLQYHAPDRPDTDQSASGDPNDPALAG